MSVRTTVSFDEDMLKLLKLKAVETSKSTCRVRISAHRGGQVCPPYGMYWLNEVAYLLLADMDLIGRNEK